MPDEDTTPTPEELQQLRDQNKTLAAQLATQQRETWKAAALKAFPLAEQFGDLVAGDTQEAVQAAAKTLHERLEKLTKKAVDESRPEVQRAAAREAYGTAAAGAGGRPVTPRNDLAGIEQKIMKNEPTTFAERQRYLQEGGDELMRDSMVRLQAQRQGRVG